LVPRKHDSLFNKINTKKDKTMFGKRELFKRELDNGRTLVFGKCVFSGEDYSVEVPSAELNRYLAGDLAQEAMPSLSTEEREFIISGISPAGWKKAFGEE
jgi:hypothetical protein